MLFFQKRTIFSKSKSDNSIFWNYRFYKKLFICKGELIFFHIKGLANCRLPFNRDCFSVITEIEHRNKSKGFQLCAFLFLRVIHHFNNFIAVFSRYGFVNGAVATRTGRVTAKHLINIFKFFNKIFIQIIYLCVVNALHTGFQKSVGVDNYAAIGICRNYTCRPIYNVGFGIVIYG